MLQISHLYADYGGKPALEDINLTLESGELLVVLGPSGCGKTTLLNLIAGFVPYQHGSIQLAGKCIEGPGAERGVVFQNEGLINDGILLENFVILSSNNEFECHPCSKYSNENIHLSRAIGKIVCCFQPSSS